MDPGSPLAAHLRRRRDLDGNSSTPGTRSGAGDASAAGAVLQSAGLELSNSGSRSHAGAAARPSGAGGEYNPKDKSLPTSMHGGVGGPFGVPQEGGAGADGGSPKIGAYHHNPVGSITKHFFMVRCAQHSVSGVSCVCSRLTLATSEQTSPVALLACVAGAECSCFTLPHCVYSAAFTVAAHTPGQLQHGL